MPSRTWLNVSLKATSVVRQRLHEKRSWICLAVLTGLLIFYCVSFWNLPLSEDAGLYGYLSRAVANGFVLHRDISFSSNSIAIYGTALVFKVAGASFDIYRLIHAVGLFSLVLAVYFIVSKRRNYARGFVAALLTGVFCVLPHIILDLGRNYIVWATAFLLVGFYVHATNIKRKETYSGVLLGIAALIRETFVLAGIALLVYEIGRLAFLNWQKKTVPYRAFLALGAAFMLTICLNAVILTYFGTWGGYLRDMLQSGASVRYEAGILDPGRIADNISHLRHGFNNYYYPILLLGSLSYFARAKDRFVSYVKYLLVPIFIVEAIVMNRTTEYSIIPILVFASILSSYLVFQVGDFFKRSTQFRAFALRVVAFALVLLFILIGMINCTLNAATQFRDYYRLAEKMSSTDLSDSTERTGRILYVASLLPNETVSTFSEYPFLFLAKKFYFTDPYVEDLSASANWNRPDLWEAQLEFISRTPPDLLILKTTTGYVSKWTDLGHIIDQNYVVVCDFPFAEIADSTFYKNRVLLSKNAFTTSYTLWKEETVETPFEGYNDRNEGIIVSVSTWVPEDIRPYSVSANSSKIQCAEEFTDDLVIFSLVPPESKFNIEPLTGATPANEQLQIKYYVRNEQE